MAKFPYNGFLLYGEISYSKISLRRNFLTAKFPYSEISYYKISHGEISYGEVFYRRKKTATLYRNICISHADIAINVFFSSIFRIPQSIDILTVTHILLIFKAIGNLYKKNQTNLYHYILANIFFINLSALIQAPVVHVSHTCSYS